MSSPETTVVHLMRHGEVHNPEGVLYGRLPDYHLSDLGRKMAERVADHLTGNLVFAAPEWSLEDAAAAMIRGGFRHLVVIEDGEIAGLLSMRDVVRCWTQEGATSDMPA